MIRMHAMAAAVGMFCCMMAALAGPAQAMQFHRVLLADNNLAIIGVGEIVDGDAARLMSLIRDMMVAAPSDHIMGFMLDSPGGQLAEGVKLATMIQSGPTPRCGGSWCHMCLGPLSPFVRCRIKSDRRA